MNELDEQIGRALRAEPLPQLSEGFTVRVLAQAAGRAGLRAAPAKAWHLEGWQAGLAIGLLSLGIGAGVVLPGFSWASEKPRGLVHFMVSEQGDWL